MKLTVFLTEDKAEVGWGGGWTFPLEAQLHLNGNLMIVFSERERKLS